jgi:long-chain acyl-CoA synthetase
MQTLLDLLQLFSQRGDKPAIYYRTGVRRLVYSYAELYEFSMAMNSVLALHGIEKGDRVLLWGPNSPWWAVSFWGCTARGAVIVPVDFMSGKEWAETIAGLTGAKLVIQSRYKPDRIQGRPMVLLEDLEQLFADRAPRYETAEVNSAEIAQIIYTSGTTGNPKGVVLTHGNLISNLRQVNEHIPVVTEQFNFLSLLPLSHMFEQMGGFLTPLYRGASIIYLRTLKPSAILDAFHEENVYAAIAVPRLLRLLRVSIEWEFAAKRLEGVFRGMLSVGRNLPLRLRKILFFPVWKKFGSHFTLFVSGGAALSPDDFRFWNAMGFTVIEGYGLTECSPVLAANTMERQTPGSVGKALPGVSLRIGNNEIQARGDNIFPGYYHNEQATREAFTPDGWFRTGDMGDMDRDGNLYVRGRSKELIVTGAGINVYPDEIEEILNGVAGVREACVIGMDRGSGEEVHAVILPDGSGRKAEEIIDEANASIDPLHRITGFSVWPEPDFPKTTTLKIRKFRVKETLLQGAPSVSSVSADPFINLIAQATGAAAGNIREDSIIVSDLGLTSIGRLELVNYLEQEFRLDIDESVIDRNTRVADLRKIVAAKNRIKAGSRPRFWTNKLFFRMLRRAGDALIHYPLTRMFMKPEVSGLELLNGARSPVMFIANHLSYLDYAAIMFSLPAKWRYNTATAAWEEFFFPYKASIPMKLWKRFTYEYGTMVLNLFPLSQTGGVRQAFRYMGRLADHRCNILLFPEGERSRDGRLLAFREGLGFMVRELRIPVVPVHISGLEKVFPPGKLWPQRGRVAVVFGKPIRFGNEAPEEIVEKARKAVEVLGTSQPE